MCHATKACNASCSIACTPPHERQSLEPYRERHAVRLALFTASHTEGLIVTLSPKPAPHPLFHLPILSSTFRLSAWKTHHTHADVQIQNAELFGRGQIGSEAAVQVVPLEVKMPQLLQPAEEAESARVPAQVVVAEAEDLQVLELAEDRRDLTWFRARVVTTL